MSDFGLEQALRNAGRKFAWLAPAEQVDGDRTQLTFQPTPGPCSRHGSGKQW